MRAYSASSEEALRARDLLKDWRGEGLLTAEQYQRMEQETVCELRRTNIFLRLVLFLFTLLIVGAACYIVDLLAAFLVPDLGQKIHTYVVIPCAIAEISMVVYLLVIGVRTSRPKVERIRAAA